MNTYKMNINHRLKAFLLIVVIFTSGTILSACTSDYSPRLILKEPSSYNYYTDEPEVNIRFYCYNIDELWLNGIKLRPRDKDLLCGYQGIDYDLEPGKNSFRFEGIYKPDTDRDRYTLRLTVTYEYEQN